MGDCEVWARTQARAPVYMRVYVSPSARPSRPPRVLLFSPPSRIPLSVATPHVISRPSRPAQATRPASRQSYRPAIRCGQSYTGPTSIDRVSMTLAAVCALHLHAYRPSYPAIIIMIVMTTWIRNIQVQNTHETRLCHYLFTRHVTSRCVHLQFYIAQHACKYQHHG